MAKGFRIYQFDIDRVLQRTPDLTLELALEIRNKFMSGELFPLNIKELTPVELVQNKVVEAVNMSDMKAKIALKNIIKNHPDCFIAYKHLIEYTRLADERMLLLEKGYEILKRTYLDNKFFHSETELKFKGELAIVYSFIYDYTHTLIGEKRFDTAYDVIFEFVELSDCKLPELLDLLSFICVRLNKKEAFDKYDRLKNSNEFLPCYYYNKALYLYKNLGECDETAEAMKKSLFKSLNIYEMILKQDYQFVTVLEFEPSSDDEAVYYLNYTYDDWRETPGAVEYLNKVNDTFVEDEYLYLDENDELDPDFNEYTDDEEFDEYEEIDGEEFEVNEIDDTDDDK